MGAICATPPHLEGAPLLQIPVESLNCDGNSNEFDNANVLQQLDAISKQSNLSYVKDYSDVVICFFFVLVFLDLFKRILLICFFEDFVEKSALVNRLWHDTDLEC